ncbi:hypothetical protein H5410_028059 [Solanum commersonii]|uniref:Uncharacterized protein n=1 Tax=Solanum commersonii TaxID=4109 RepID=A0A9J5Z3W6_SOLCO|nr:hypothetical protein H5410_028059 [Solanum commersonii]
MGAGWNLPTTSRWLFGPPTLSFILVDHRVTKRVIVVAVWLPTSTNTQPADRYYVIEESGSARYG